jgi:hypothetical protein
MVPLLAALGGTWWLLTKYLRDPANSEETQLAHECLAILALLTFRSFFNNMMTIHPPLPFLAIVGYAEFLRRRQKTEAKYVAPDFNNVINTQGESAAETYPDEGNLDEHHCNHLHG